MKAAFSEVHLKQKAPNEFLVDHRKTLVNFQRDCEVFTKMKPFFARLVT